MKKLLLYFLVITVFHSIVSAQVQTVKRFQHHKIDSNSIVKDSAGVRYKYAEWRKLVQSGYMLRATDPGNDSTAYTVVKMDEDAKNRLLSMKPIESSSFTNGQKMELFSTNSIDGYKIRPKELEGKVVVLNFWFIDCPPCRQEIPELNKIALSYANDPNIVFIAVALDYAHDLKKFIKDNPFAYHVVEYGRKIADSYGVRNFPTSVILDKQGIIKFHTMGYGLSTAHWIKKTIEEVSK